jgi:hypothetical protein
MWISEGTITSLSCGGFSTFVIRFNDVCRSLLKREGIADEIKREEQKIKTIILVEMLLDLLMSFGEFQEDDDPSRVSQVLLRTAPEPETEPPVDDCTNEIVIPLLEFCSKVCP